MRKRKTIKQQVHDLLKKNPKLTCQEVADKMKKSYQSVYPSYKSFDKSNVAVSVRKRKSPTDTTKRTKSKLNRLTVKVRGKTGMYGDVPILVTCQSKADKRKTHSLEITNTNIDDLQDMLIEGMVIPLNYNIISIQVGGSIK